MENNNKVNHETSILKQEDIERINQLADKNKEKKKKSIFNIFKKKEKK